jgi:hypothetical protein
MLKAWTQRVMLIREKVAMRPARIIAVFVFAAAVAVTGCTAPTTDVRPSAAPAPTATPIIPSRPPTTKPPTTPHPGPHRLYFATPQASMRYLAVAYNRNDLAALKHVTTPVARSNLLFMRPNADNLRLVGCTANVGRGDYNCAFTHDYPAAMHQTGHGQAHFTAAPADKVGWYMTVLNDCS